MAKYPEIRLERSLKDTHRITLPDGTRRYFTMSEEEPDMLIQISENVAAEYDRHMIESTRYDTRIERINRHPDLAPSLWTETRYLYVLPPKKCEQNHTWETTGSHTDDKTRFTTHTCTVCNVRRTTEAVWE